jgi:hypothetical protein
MARATRILIAGLAAMVVVGSSRPAAGQDLTVTLQVQNRAHVADDVLARAEAEVTRIYARAGVHAVWASAGQVTVMILTREASDLMNPIKDAMGFAPGTETVRGRVAYILAYRVDDVAQAHGMDKAVMLGGAMAHEVGHLLLSINAHSKTGIMRADWNEGDFRRASCRQLFFTGEQAAQIRTRMRNSQQEASLAMAR